ncbi:DeoR family transcriptional regulator, partial [Actinotignum schaalii]
MSRQERLSALADMVLERGSITVEDAVEELGVSPATV